MIYIGIDPGKSGAMAVIWPNDGKTWIAYRRKPDTKKEDKHEAD